MVEECFGYVLNQWELQAASQSYGANSEQWVIYERFPFKTEKCVICPLQQKLLLKMLSTAKMLGWNILVH